MRQPGASIIQSGDLDTLIRIEVAYPVDDEAYGTDDVVEWALVEEVWAQVRDVLPSRANDRVEGGAELSRRPARIRARWIDGVTSKMRIVIETKDDDGVVVDTRTMAIIGEPAMLGRREGIEIMAENYSTPGAPIEATGEGD